MSALQGPLAGRVFSARPLTELKSGPRDTPSMNCGFKANFSADKREKRNLPYDTASVERSLQARTSRHEGLSRCHDETSVAS